MRGAEAFDPCGLCAKPRLGHLRWPGAEAVAPSVRPAEPSGWTGREGAGVEGICKAAGLGLKFALIFDDWLLKVVFSMKNGL